MADEVKLTENERKAVVDGLITNEACCWEESDREVLNTLSDVTLAKLHRQQELLVNAEGEDEGDKDVFKVKNDPTGAQKDELEEDSEEDVAVEEETTQPSNNRQAVLSKQDRADLSFARHYRMEQRRRHVNVITANANNKFTAKQLWAMSDTVLANMASLAAQPVEESVFNMESQIRPSFFGQQGAAVTNAGANADEEPLTLGRIDYKELASSNGSRK